MDHIFSFNLLRTQYRLKNDARYIPDVSVVFDAKKKNEATQFRRNYIKRLNEANVKRGIAEPTDNEEASVEDGINELLNLETTYIIPVLSISNKAILTQMYSGNFESVFEQQLNSINELESTDAFLKWMEAKNSARLTDDFFRVTLPNEFDKNHASGPVWNAFLAVQVVLGSHVLFGTGTVAQLLPTSSGTKKAYDKHHVFSRQFS